MTIEKKIDRDDFIKNVEHWLALIGEQYGDEEDEELTFEILEECVKFLNFQNFETEILSRGQFGSLDINVTEVKK